MGYVSDRDAMTFFPLESSQDPFFPQPSFYNNGEPLVFPPEDNRPALQEDFIFFLGKIIPP